MKTSNQTLRDFGNRVRDLRKLHGFSQEQFAFDCGLDRTYVSQVEQGRRNISLQNIKAMAGALHVPIAELFTPGISCAGVSTTTDVAYRVKKGGSIQCGFSISGPDILSSAGSAARQLQMLPFSLYQSIDLKTLSSIVGAIFAGCLANKVGAIINPIEKGHPDIIPKKGRNATEAQLRNYPEGLEIKVTVGNVKKGSNLHPGQPRISKLTGITWQAHHREVESLLGLIVDFAGAEEDSKNFPVITGVFYTDDLIRNDWGEISGTTGRNTKVTGMKLSGRCKMGCGWLVVIDNEKYISKYSRLLNLEME